MRALTSWFGLRKEKSEPGGGGTTKSAAVQPAPRVVAPVVPARPVAAAPTPMPVGDVFEQFIALAKIEVPPDVPLTDEQREADARLEELVLEHYFENQPAPHSFPGLSLKIINLLANPDVQLNDLAKLISQDAAITSQIIRFANSVAYAGVSRIESVRDAAARMGLEQVSKVAAMVSSRSLFNPDAKADFALFGRRWNELFHESASLSWGASWFASTVKGGRSDSAYLGGMMVEIGKTIAMRSLATLAAKKAFDFERDPAAIDRVLTSVHPKVGLDAVKVWGLPESLLQIIELHRTEGLPAEPEFLETHIVRTMLAIQHLRTAPAFHPHSGRELRESAAALGQTAHSLRAADTQLREVSEGLKKNFELKK